MSSEKSSHQAAKPFVANVDVALADRMIHDLKGQGFTISKPQYTLFSAKKKGVSCTLYESGKLLVQGKEMQAFIEFYIEPEVLGAFTFTYQSLEIDLTPRIGIDEAGKGDFFGPLCVAGVQASGDQIAKLKELGVRDSKAMTDQVVIKLGNQIRKHCPYHILKINPVKYNELYGKFRNLNTLLGWGHATTIESLVAKTGCKNVIIDQFAAERVVEDALKKKMVQVNLSQRHRGEEDLVVAAASILARQAFLEGLEQLGREYALKLPKGASQKTIEAGRYFLRKYGKEALKNVAKLHFKTYDVILEGSSIE